MTIPKTSVICCFKSSLFTYLGGIMNNERKFKGVWIPKEIWLNKELTPLEKMYLVEIDSLDDEETGCFASNKHFNEMFGQTGSNISRIIENLKDKGWIEVEYIYIGKEIDKRVIKIKRPPYPNRYAKNDYTYTKNDNGVLSKLVGGYAKNDYDRYTYIDKQLDNKEKYIKKKYGEFGNVLLTDEEYHKLEKSNLLSYIERLSSYIASKGKRYKSHYATILNWSRKDKPNKKTLEEIIGDIK